MFRFLKLIGLYILEGILYVCIVMPWLALVISTIPFTLFGALLLWIFNRPRYRTHNGVRAKQMRF